MQIKKIQLFLLFVILIYNSCGIYSFSGVNTDGAQTITFSYFDNVSKIVNPQLTQTFYDEMYQRFVNQTSLKYSPKDGDIFFDGKIVDYSVKPVDIKSGDVAAYNRLTIIVKVTYKNFKNPKNNFEKTFSWYSDYNSSTMLSDVEEQLTKDISKKIVEDIFNASVVNW